MEAHNHFKVEDKFHVCSLFAALHYFCLQESVRKEIISLAEASLFFTGIDQKELGVVDLLTENFKIRSDIWWLQEHMKKWNIVIF